MDIDPETAAVKASSKYGTRSRIAFSSLGTRPMEMLLEGEEPMSVSQMRQALDDDEQAEGVQRWSVQRYFKVLEEYDMVEYEEDGPLFRGWDSTVSKNGTSYEEFESFVERYPDPE